MTTRMTDDELDAWQRLQVVTEQLRRRVGADLRSDADLSEAEFTVLAHLVDMGGSARPSRCAAAIGWDSSRLSHQLRRLEKRRLVERRVGVSEDARGAVIAATEAGLTAHRAAVGSHLRAARTWFADGLDGEQLRGLREALQALESHVQHLDEQNTPTPDGAEQ